MDQYHPVCVSVSRLRPWLGNCTALAGTHLIRGISRNTPWRYGFNTDVCQRITSQVLQTRGEICSVTTFYLKKTLC